MKLFQLFRTAGVALALVLFGAGSFAAVSPYWQAKSPGTTGAWLGDADFNLFTLWRAHVTGAGTSFTGGISASQTLTQAGCTQLNSDMMQQVSTSAATGAVCLPTAIAGKQVYIGNSTGQTIDIFGSAVTAVSGTQDFINGTTGTTAYAGLTTGKVADCVAVNTGIWFCASGS